MNQHWFFLILISSDTQLSFKVQSKGIYFPFNILYKRMIGSCIYCYNFHLFQSMHRTGFMNILSILSQLSITISTISITLVFIFIKIMILLRIKACYSPTATPMIPCPTLTNPDYSLFYRPRPHRVR